jgi:uncharacterized protein
VGVPERLSLRTRRVVAVAVLVAGFAATAWALRIEPGDPLFYVGTAVLAAVWLGGAWLCRPVPVRGARRVGSPGWPVVPALVVGVLLLLVFLLGALVVGQVPVLRAPVEELLDHARAGSLALVALGTLVNGVAEELFFRGALYDVLPRRHAVLGTVLGYTAVTAAAGIPLLALAGLALGLVTALQRRATAGILAPAVTHVTFTLGMLFLLPPVLDLAG